MGIQELSSSPTEDRNDPHYPTYNHINYGEKE
jgi:hypothetical protein